VMELKLDRDKTQHNSVIHIARGIAYSKS